MTERTKAAELSVPQLPAINVGNADFADARLEGSVFVDKTGKLAQLVRRKKVFFSRPRRFGKTMLISMLEELFRHGTAKFEGLAVAQQWPETQCYTVLSFSLFGLQNPTNFERDLCATLRDAFNRAGFPQALTIEPNLTQVNLLLPLLSNFLTPGTRVVLLIDEWDFPLSSHLDDPKAFNHNCEIINYLFIWVRSLKNLRFLLVTGIGRYRSNSLFSGHDIVDISLEPEFADLVGYTQAEVETFFAPHIAQAAQLLGLTIPDLLAKLKQYYDGFCFERNAQITLYNPWSINSFFQQVALNPTVPPTFRLFWQDSALSPKALDSYLKWLQPDLTFLDQVEDQGIAIPEHSFALPIVFNQIDLQGLLVQTGYLTLKQVIDPDICDDTRSYRCSFPNLETKAFCAKRLLHHITTQNKDEAWFNRTSSQLKTAMHMQDMAAATAALNEFLCALPYDVSVKAHEAEFRTFICWSLLFSQSYDRIREESFNTKGRSDLEVEIAGNLYVIELKLLPKKEGKQAGLTLADQAQDQIQDRIYGHNLATWQIPRYQQCWGLVLVLSAQTRQIAYWRFISCDHDHSQYQVLGDAWCKPLKTDTKSTKSNTKSTKINKRTKRTTTKANAKTNNSTPAPSAQLQDTSDPMALKLALQLELKLAAITPQHPITLDPDFLIEGLLLTYDEMRTLELDATALAQKLPALVQVVLTKAQAAPTDQPLTVDAELLEQRLLQELSRSLSLTPPD